MKWKYFITVILLFLVFIFSLSFYVYNYNNDINNEFPELNTSWDVYEYLITCKEETIMIDCEQLFINRMEVLLK